MAQAAKAEVAEIIEPEQPVAGDETAETTPVSPNRLKLETLWLFC
jgi:hypothetical protein